MAHATALLGDRWSMLIVREMLDGEQRYQRLKQTLGISDHTLTRRLTHLVDIGVLERDGSGSGRYRLTEAGADLARVLAVLGEWGMRWLPVHAPLRTPPQALVRAGRTLGIEIPRSP